MEIKIGLEIDGVLYGWKSFDDPDEAAENVRDVIMDAIGFEPFRDRIEFEEAVERHTNRID